jgi:hypothetical protein
MVQSIGVHGYIASSPILSLPQVLKKEVGIDKILQISSAISMDCFDDLFWCRGSKINIKIQKLALGFYAPVVIEDILSPFYMFDIDG